MNNGDILEPRHLPLIAGALDLSGNKLAGHLRITRQTYINYSKGRTSPDYDWVAKTMLPRLDKLATDRNIAMATLRRRVRLQVNIRKKEPALS